MNNILFEVHAIEIILKIGACMFWLGTPDQYHNALLEVGTEVSKYCITKILIHVFKHPIMNQIIVYMSVNMFEALKFNAITLFSIILRQTHQEWRNK